MPDVALTSRFVQAIGMEAVRQIHDHPAGHPEEATVDAIRRLIRGESAAPAPDAAPARKSLLRLHARGRPGRLPGSLGCLSGLTARFRLRAPT
jgi:anti-sigma factor RsiW